MVEVVAALIWDNDKFMICQRPANKACALLWEFVGGKVEPSETKAQALIRECQEELDITISVGNEFMNVKHVYPDGTVHLTLFTEMQTRTKTYTGWTAQIIQHEVDHGNGILI